MRQPSRALVTGAARPGGIGSAIAARLRDVDVLVANAGLPTIFGAAHTLPLERWRHNIEVNLTGSFRVVRGDQTLNALSVTSSVIRQDSRP